MLNKILFNHFTAFLLAIAFSGVIISYTPLQSDFINYDKGATSSVFPDTSRKTMGNYDLGYGVELTFRNAIHNGNSIVVIGSSEMSRSDLKAMPYNFFNANKIPSFGFGHEGNQCLAIMAQLAVLHKELKDAKVVIILSPGWFESPYASGTSLQSFLEFMNERFLYLLYFDNQIPDETKEYVYTYIEKNYKDIVTPSAIHTLIYYTSKSHKNLLHRVVFSPLCCMYKLYCEVKMKYMTHLFYHNHSSMPYTDEPYKVIANKYSTHVRINWDSLKAAATNEFKAISNNNEYGIENAYYDKYMKANPVRTIGAIDEKDNIEFNDFEKLLDLLKSINCKPLFVVQPLNPLIYSNIHDIDPILTRVQEELKKNNFEYLNLHTSDKNEYVKGTLVDYQHLGNLGWYEIDEKTYTYFNNNKSL